MHAPYITDPTPSLLKSGETRVTVSYDFLPGLAACDVRPPARDVRELFGNECRGAVVLGDYSSERKVEDVRKSKFLWLKNKHVQ